ncbi:MAG: hypothetical protein R3B84_05175 [Zavarzinella sp.]
MKWIIPVLLVATGYSTAAPKIPVKKLPPQVHGIGVYSSLDRDSKKVIVKIQDSKAPIILVLSAYDSVKWEIVAPKGVVRRVIVSGYHLQEVSGLEKTVPIDNTSYDAGDKTGYFYCYRAPVKVNPKGRVITSRQKMYDKMLEKIKVYSDSELTSFQGQYSSKEFQIPKSDPFEEQE